MQKPIERRVVKEEKSPENYADAINRGGIDKKIAQQNSKLALHTKAHKSPKKHTQHFRSTSITRKDPNYDKTTPSQTTFINIRKALL